MENRAPLIASLALMALADGVSVWGWLHIPDGARIAVHCAANGKINGWWPKSRALEFGPLMALALTAGFAAAPAAGSLRF